MPTYGYRCEKCLEMFTIHAGLAEYERGLDAQCPKCGSKDIRRTISAISILTPSRGKASSSKKGCCCGPGCCG
jgi:putative FmdB family regulatory protein